MPQIKKKTTDDFKLRQRAESALEASFGDNGCLVEFSSDEMNTIIYDLQVHQIELEMQNVELKRSQAELVLLQV